MKGSRDMINDIRKRKRKLWLRLAWDGFKFLCVLVWLVWILVDHLNSEALEDRCNAACVDYGGRFGIMLDEQPEGMDIDYYGPEEHRCACLFPHMLETEGW